MSDRDQFTQPVSDEPVRCFKLYNGLDVVVQGGVAGFLHHPRIIIHADDRHALQDAMQRRPIRWYNKPSAIQLATLEDGEYWLCGPGILGNMERFTFSVLVKKWGHLLEDVPLMVPALQIWLATQDLHGVRVQQVNHPDSWIDFINDRRKFNDDGPAMIRFTGTAAGE